MRYFEARDSAGARRPQSEREAFAPEFPDYIEDVVLAADTIQRITIPSGAAFVVFSFDGDFRAKIGVVGTDLTLPSASTSNGSGSELNPAARRVPAVLGDGSTVPTHIVLRSASAQTGSLSFYG